MFRSRDAGALRPGSLRRRAVSLGGVAWLVLAAMAACSRSTNSDTSATSTSETTVADVAVPNIVGLSRDCAEQFLAERQLRWSYQGTSAVRSVPIGTFSEPPPAKPTILVVPRTAYPTPEVLVQDPVPGARVRPGAVVVFSTRGGPEVLSALPLQPPKGVLGPEQTCGSSLDERRR